MRFERLAMKRLISLSFSFLIHFVSFSQNVDTDIFVFDVDFGKGKLSNARNITKWKGYDNQPFFGEDSKVIYFTRAFRDQSDAYYYEFQHKVVREFTGTKTTSEYSPTLTPDGKFISVVRVEEDSAQRLWKFPLDMGDPLLVFEKIKPVGYHVWVDDITVAMFVLGSPNALHIANTATGNSKPVAYDIGRSLHYYQGGVYFVHKESEAIWWIKRYDVESGEMSRIVESLTGREDFTVTSTGKILMGDGEKIYQLKSGKWKKVFTIKNEQIKDFNRMVLSKDEKKLALVSVMK